MTAAHRLYERLGFHRLPERDWSPVPGVDLLVYARDIQAPSVRLERHGGPRPFSRPEP
jgi:hypothetical protein